MFSYGSMVLAKLHVPIHLNTRARLAFHRTYGWMEPLVNIVSCRYV